MINFDFFLHLLLLLLIMFGCVFVLCMTILTINELVLQIKKKRSEYEKNKSKL